MYVVAAGWAYVTILMAATAPTITQGVLTFLLYGAGPIALFLWFGRAGRRRLRARAQQLMREPDGGDAQRDQ